MPSVIDLTIDNAIYYEMFKTGSVKRAAPILNELNKQITNVILLMDENLPRSVSEALREINTLIDDAFLKILLLSSEEQRGFVEEVVEDEDEIVVLFGKTSLTTKQKESATNSALAALVMGSTFRQQLRHLKVVTKRRVVSRVKQGILDKENSKAIATAVRGTARSGYRDGAFNPTLSNMDTILRTALAAYANKAKQQVMRVSGVDKYVWISVLDSKTTPICRKRSKKVYQVGNGPIPPAHYACRSSTAPYNRGDRIPDNIGEWLLKQPLSRVKTLIGAKQAERLFNKQIKPSEVRVRKNLSITLQQLQQRGV